MIIDATPYNAHHFCCRAIVRHGCQIAEMQTSGSVVIRKLITVHMIARLSCQYSISMYTVSQKRDLYTFASNFGRCWRIFEIFPLLNSSRNLQQTDCHISRHTLNVLLHYLVNWLVTSSHFHIKTMHSTSIVTNKMATVNTFSSVNHIKSTSLSVYLFSNNFAWISHVARFWAVNSCACRFLKHLSAISSIAATSFADLTQQFFESSFFRFFSGNSASNLVQL